ncbi:histidine phosphatase family protein [Enterococcus faecalis]
MTEATTLYIIRHGKTMFNTIGRTQGWSDTPLTKQGEEGIYHLGLGLRDIDFREAYSSDSGRAMQTAQIILQEHQNHQNIPYLTDKRIREWCFGSLDGGYDGELWGVVPRILAFKSYEDMMTTIRDRVWSGFEDIAHHREKNGGGKVMVVSHGLTISFLLSLIDASLPMQMALENGSVTTLTYEKGTFTIQGINDISYIEKGKKIAEKRH